MKKTIGMMILFPLTALALFAGGGGDKAAPASQNKPELTLWVGSWWEPWRAGIIEDFEKTYPQYRLKVDCLPINGYYDNAATSILSGNPPDILDMTTAQVASFAGRNLLTDITQSVGSKLQSSDFMHQAWDKSWFQGKMYGMPTRGYGDVIYYNKTLFDKAGVPYPTDTWTINDLLEFAKKITDPANDVYGFAIGADASDPGNVSMTFGPCLWLFGADYMNTDNTLCTLNTPEAVKAITFWSEFLTKWHVVPAGTVSYTISRDLIPLFNQGKIGMIPYMTGGIDIFSKNPDLKWGMAQWPSYLNRAEGAAMTIPVTAKYAKEAVDFLLWYSKAETQSKHNSREPANIAAWDLGPPWNDEQHKAIAFAGNHGKTVPAFAKWADAQLIIVAELQQVLLQKKTPQQAGNDMTAQVNALLK